MLGSITIDIEQIFRDQGIYDECPWCRHQFWWLISAGSPLCPKCFMQRTVSWEEMIELREKTLEQL